MHNWLEKLSMDDVIVEKDPNSFANVGNFSINKVNFDLIADFHQKIFKGNVDLTFHFKKDTQFIILDSRDLKINFCKVIIKNLN
jgi:aminopeptidase N